jgi:hypothetical protein
MPYPRAHYYVLGVMAVTVAGFWPSYFGPFLDVPWQFHAHGVAASVWVLMVAAQSWTVRHKHLPLHRAVGKSSLMLFPFLIAGLAAIIDLTAKSYVAGVESRLVLGGSFLLGLALAVAAYVVLYYRALKYRRRVWLHSGYMLATPVILWESPFSRLIEKLPPLNVTGPQDFPLVIHSIVWAMASALAFCLFMRWRFGERAHPFLVAGIFVAAQMVAMGQLGDLAVVHSALAAIGYMPSAAVIILGFALGAATSWAGWQAGKRPAVPIAGTAQPA